MRKLILLCGAGLTCLPTIAGAATVIDQQQTTYEADVEVYRSQQIFGNDYRAFQTFVPTYSNSVGAGVYIGFGSALNGNIRLTLYYLPGGIGSGVAVASGTETITQTNAWADVFWSSETPIVAGATYRLEVSSVNNDGILNEIGFARDYYPNGYASGEGIVGSGFDLTFRTFADDGAAAVPEPATWAMMILGFGAIGIATRRRRRLAACRP